MGPVRSDTGSLEVLCEFVEVGLSLHDQPQEINVHSRRYVGRASDEAADVSIGHIEVAGYVGLPARPVKSLANVAE